MNTPMAVRTRRGVLAIAALGGAALLLAMAGTPLLANQTPATVSTTDTKPDVKVDVQDTSRRSCTLPAKVRWWPFSWHVRQVLFTSSGLASFSFRMGPGSPFSLTDFK